MIDFDEHEEGVMDIVAVTDGDKKRVEVNEGKLTEKDMKLFRRGKEAELQSWFFHKVFDVVYKKVGDKNRVVRARWVLTWKTIGKAKARLCICDFKTQI